MSEEQPPRRGDKAEAHEEDGRQGNTGLGVGLSLGMTLGAAVGVVTDNLAMWLALGVVIGMSAGQIFDSKNKS
ncbi:MAG: hypothetical protein ACTHZ9_00895 [Leucobacter sp.]